MDCGRGDKITDEFLTGSVRGLEDAWARTVVRWDDAGEAFHNLAEGILADLARIQARMVIANLISGISSLLGPSEFEKPETYGLPARSGASLSSFEDPATYGLAPKAHGGGVFTGPESDYPVLLHGTETVLTEEQTRHLAPIGATAAPQVNVTVINNNPDADVQVRQGGTGQDFEIFIGKKVSQALSRPGGAPQRTLRNEYGLTPRTRGR